MAPWKSKNKCFSENNHFKDMNRIDGMPPEFEWTIFPGITALGLLEMIQKLMTDLQCEPEHFNDKIIFMSMYNDIAWWCKRKYRTIRIQFTDSCVLRSQIPSRPLVFLEVWIRKAVVRNPHWQTWRILGPNCREHDVEFLRFRSSNISFFLCVWERRTENQRAWQEVNTLQW